MPVRVMVVDDHGIVRAGLRGLLTSEADIAVVGKPAASRTPSEKPLS